MKRNSWVILLIPAFIIVLSGCTAVGDIFKAGVWVGIIIVVVVILIIVWIASAFKK